MIETVAYAACAVLAALTIFQTLLLFGAPLGRYTQGGRNVVLSPEQRAVCAISIVLYFIFALIILNQAQLVTVFDAIADVGIWILVVFFFIGVGMNGISRSKHERVVMTPVALMLALLCLFLAMN